MRKITKDEIIENLVKKNIDNDYKFNDLVFSENEDHKFGLVLKVNEGNIVGVVKINEQIIEEIIEEHNKYLRNEILINEFYKNIFNITYKNKGIFLNVNMVAKLDENNDEYFEKLNKLTEKNNNYIVFENKDLTPVRDKNGVILARKNISLDFILKCHENDEQETFNSLVFFPEVMNNLIFDSESEENIKKELFFRLEDLCFNNLINKNLCFDIIKNRKYEALSQRDTIIMIKENDEIIALCQVNYFHMNKFVVFNKKKFNEIIQNIIKETKIKEFIEKDKIETVFFESLDDFMDNPLLILEKNFNFKIKNVD